MSRTVLLVAHSPSREGRVAPLLSAKGYDVEWCCPADGDALPPVDTYAGAVVFGGVQSANDAPATSWLQREVEWIADFAASGRPFLGICLGAQLLARALGARVGPRPDGVNEIGYYPLTSAPAGRDMFPESLRVYQWHKEGFDLPAGAELLATGDAFPNQAFRHGAAAYGLQFHPEVTTSLARQWLDTAAHCLSRPGAQPREAQLADSARFDPPLHDWTDRFLDRWLAAGNGAR